MCKELYFVDYIDHDGDVAQYGQTTFDIEKARKLLEEAVHAYRT